MPEHGRSMRELGFPWLIITRLILARDILKNKKNTIDCNMYNNRNDSGSNSIGDEKKAQQHEQ